MAGKAAIGAGAEQSGHYVTGETVFGEPHVISIINQLSETEPGDILKIAASQIKLLDSYYNAVLTQATMSFRWALIAAGIGLAFFPWSHCLLAQCTESKYCSGKHHRGCDSGSNIRH